MNWKKKKRKRQRKKKRKSRRQKWPRRNTKRDRGGSKAKKGGGWCESDIRWKMNLASGPSEKGEKVNEREPELMKREKLRQSITSRKN